MVSSAWPVVTAAATVEPALPLRCALALAVAVAMAMAVLDAAGHAVELTPRQPAEQVEPPGCPKGWGSLA